MTTTASDVTSWSVREMAEAVRHREVSSRELVGAHLDRIERLNPDVNAVVTLEPRALAAAEAADRAIVAGEDVGPFHGVPVTIKDALCTAGLRTTSGYGPLADHVPDRDATSVALLRRAGAVVIGKTNLPPLAGDAQSFNELFGATSNPWDLARTAGGSSGGSAAAVAAGFAPLDLGSDIAGSIRGPAAMCGVCGHKPSYGVVPHAGHVPGMPGQLTAADLSVVGPLARSVDDLAQAMTVLPAPSEWDAPAWRIDLPRPRPRRLDECRLAVWSDDDHCPPDRRIVAAIDRLAVSISSTGAVCDPDARPDFSLAYSADVFERLLGGALSGSFTLDELEAHGRGDQPGSDDALASKWAAQRHRAWLSANERRLQMRRKWAQFFERYDAVLMPVLPNVAAPHDHSMPAGRRPLMIDGVQRSYWDQIVWTGPASQCYLPSTVIPIAVTDDGLPIGVQVVGAYLADWTTLAVAAWLAELVGPLRPAPGTPAARFVAT